jgi:hypothetical protein
MRVGLLIPKVAKLFQLEAQVIAVARGEGALLDFLDQGFKISQAGNEIGGPIC